MSEIQTKLCLASFIARDTVPHTTAHRYMGYNPCLQIHFLSIKEETFMSNESARTEGYVRGLEGKGSSASWGQMFDDNFANPSGSAEARERGYQEGLRDRAFNQSRNEDKK